MGLLYLFWPIILEVTKALLVSKCQSLAICNVPIGRQGNVRQSYTLGFSNDVGPVVLLVFESARGSRRLRGIMVYEIPYMFICPCVIRTVFAWLMSIGN